MPRGRRAWPIAKPADAAAERLCCRAWTSTSAGRDRSSSRGIPPGGRSSASTSKASSSRSSSASSPSWSASTASVFVVVLVVLALTVAGRLHQTLGDDLHDHQPPPQHQARDHLAGDPGDAAGAGPERQLQPVGLPAADADRRRRLRHRRERRLRLHLLRRRRPARTSSQRVDRATGADAAGSHGLGEPQPPGV